MRVVVLCGLIVFLGIGGVSAGGVELKNGGYEGVVFAISSDVEEAQGAEIISGIKAMVKEGTNVLFHATRRQTFFRDVRVLLPMTWTNTPFDKVASYENFKTSSFRVDKPNPVYNNQPYTLQPDGCGRPGLFTHFTPDYLTDHDTAREWGNPGKLLAHEWAKLRWGVFSEFGFPNDERFPLFYLANPREDVKAEVKPTSCANEPLTGSFRDVTTRGFCKNTTERLPDDNCRFIPNSIQKANTSLASYYNPDSILSFCDDSEQRPHDTSAPTKQNLYCNHRSVWSVMMKHSDFADTENAASHLFEPPVFTVVRPADASFALVLDYSGSMRMSVDRITKMQNSARRWILSEVAVGSSVGIVRFSTDAHLDMGLTTITENGDERKTLAKAIDNSESGSTCIRCGIEMAYNQVLNDRTNAVILLITDGQENEGNLENTIPELVKRDIRVITVAFGNQADYKLEKLAEATGGTTYTVFDEEEGNNLDDAFMRALTYQPGDSISEVNIKIDQRFYNGSAKSHSEKFTVDASVGRNLQFRLESEPSTHVTGGPILLSPNGTTYDNVKFEELTNVWTLKVDIAEAGEWQWKVTLSGTQGHSVRVDVTAQARDPEYQKPIYTHAWVNAKELNATEKQITAFARVQQGNSLVVRARVRAYITTENLSFKVDLYDNGKGADNVKDDGIYSQFLSGMPVKGRYSVKAQVWSDGDALVNNGFLASRSLGLRHTRSLPVDPLKVTTYCCGSRIPLDPDTATPTGNFTRLSTGGSFSVTEVSPTGDSYPPGKVVDFKVTLHTNNSLSLSWTAPGDDFDQGTVSGYILRYSVNSTDLIQSNFDHLNESSIINLPSSITNLLLEVEGGAPVARNVTLDDIVFQADEVYFFAIKAFDDVGLSSSVSNIVRVQLPSESGEGKARPCWPIISVLGCLLLTGLK